MNCPGCNASQVKVVDSRPMDSGAVVRRRRGCMECGHKWTTYEVDSDQLQFLKRDREMRPTKTRTI